MSHFQKTSGCHDANFVANNDDKGDTMTILRFVLCHI